MEFKPSWEVIHNRVTLKNEIWNFLCSKFLQIRMSQDWIFQMSDINYITSLTELALGEDNGVYVYVCFMFPAIWRLIIPPSILSTELNMQLMLGNRIHINYCLLLEWATVGSSKCGLIMNAHYLYCTVSYTVPWHLVIIQSFLFNQILNS